MPPETSSAMSRRAFIGTATATGVLASMPHLLASTDMPSRASAPRNLILLVSDGMNQGTLSLANRYRMLKTGKPCEWFRLYSPGEGLETRRALMDTASASSLVTDSAAAGSAWSCGVRVPNGHLNTQADGTPLQPLFPYARAAGKSVGVVTTTRVTHATPASFCISEQDRDAEERIAEKYLSSGVDLFMGGGQSVFSASSRKDGRDLFSEFAQLGYTVIRSRQELAALNAPPSKILATFYPSHLPYTIDHLNQPDLQASVPTLAEMTSAALKTLEANPQGFVLQVEGGRVDHAGHANDAGAILHDQLAFDDCIALARRFAQRVPDTLVIVTTDHGTGGCILNGVGKNYNDNAKAFAALDSLKASFEHLEKTITADTPLSVARKLLLDKMGLEVSAAFAADLMAFDEDRNANAASDLLCKKVFEHTGVHFTSHNHTGEAVELAAFGPGSQKLPQILENWELHGFIRDALAF